MRQWLALFQTSLDPSPLPLATRAAGSDQLQKKKQQTNETTMKTETEIDLTKQLQALGFDLTASDPSGGVDDSKWPHIAYEVKLTFKGKLVLQTTYRLGVGHIDIQKLRGQENQLLFSSKYKFVGHEAGFAESWSRQPSANFKDKAMQASVAAKIAKVQKVTPSLPSVLDSLLLDGQADDMTFEQWAASFGYDTDSRKAEQTYNACQAHGKALRLAVPADVLTSAREILQDY